MGGVVAVGLMVVLGVPFAAGVGTMALPIGRAARIAVACAPVGLLALAIGTGYFWLGDIGSAFIAFIATWAWLLGVGVSRDLRSVARLVARVARAKSSSGRVFGDDARAGR
jgi:hypothetical protein